MKGAIRNAVLMVAVVGLAGMMGCSEAQQTSFGQQILSYDTTSIRNVKSNADNILNDIVTLEGVIIAQFSSGTRFELKDSTGVIYVDIGSSDFNLPELVGRPVYVEGEVTLIAERGVSLIGHGVELK